MCSTFVFQAYRFDTGDTQHRAATLYNTGKTINPEFVAYCSTVSYVLLRGFLYQPFRSVACVMIDACLLFGRKPRFVSFD